MEICVMNTANGQVQTVPEQLMNDAHFREYHVEVPEGTKSFDAKLYTPKTAAEFKHVHKIRVTEPAADVVTETKTEKDGK